MTFPYDTKPRLPQIQITECKRDLVKFTLTDTDISVANALRRIILAEVPAMAVEIVNISENESVLFDEFLAHRMGLLPLSSHSVGDIPPDEKRPGAFVDHKECNCFDGCPYCTVEYKLDVHNTEDKVMNVTHFDMIESGKFRRDGVLEHQQVRICPFPNPSLDPEKDAKENGIILCKLKKDQRLKMTCHARKGIPKFHSKFMPVATSLYQYQPVVTLDREEVDSLSLDQKVELVNCCPRKVFELDIEDKVQVERLMDCIFCDECVTKGREFKKKDMCTVKQDLNMFHFTMEGITVDGPRDMVEVLRASIRILDYKLSLFLKDSFGDEIDDFLPVEPQI